MRPEGGSSFFIFRSLQNPFQDLAISQALGSSAKPTQKRKMPSGTFFIFSDSLLVASSPTPQNIYNENIEMANNTRRIHIRVTDEEYEDLLRQEEFMKFPSYSDLIRMYIILNPASMTYSK